MLSHGRRVVVREGRAGTQRTVGRSTALGPSSEEGRRGQQRARLPLLPLLPLPLLLALLPRHHAVDGRSCFAAGRRQCLRCTARGEAFFALSVSSKAVNCGASLLAAAASISALLISSRRSSSTLSLKCSRRPRSYADLSLRSSSLVSFLLLDMLAGWESGLRARDAGAGRGASGGFAVNTRWFTRRGQAHAAQERVLTARLSWPDPLGTGLAR